MTAERLRQRRVLVAGATGHIGSHIARAVHESGAIVRALARDATRLDAMRDSCDEVVIAEATRAETLTGLCDGVDVVISALGLRTLRARPSPELVDLHANLNVLACARAAGVRRFVFVAVLHGRRLAESLPILRPREAFVRALVASPIEWTVLRPSGAFNDMQAIFKSAQRGLGVVLGRGAHHINPIHAADIASVAVRAMTDASMRNVEYAFGGPESYTQRGLVREAFAALDARPRVLHLPPQLVDAAAAMIRPFNRNAAGFLRFFRTVATTDMVGAAEGDHSLAAYFRELASRDRPVRGVT